MDVGIRVVRGPSWNWGDQDGGCVGTVIRPFDSSYDIVQSGTVFVQWDDGTVGNYRVGKDEEFDLRIFDSGPAGVRFRHYCDECGQKGIIGTRWQCTVCHDYDLCHSCYHDNKHDLTHPFRRFNFSPSTDKVTEVPPRANSEKNIVLGIFPGAEVLRCVEDWLRDQNDGGMDGIPGVVIDDPPSGLSVYSHGSVLVSWQSGETVEHSCGNDGRVAIKCFTPGVGPKCYIDHLAVLEEDFIVRRLDDARDSGEGGHQLLPSHNMSDEDQENTNTFDVGDQVRILSEEQKVRSLQRGFGGWVQKMKEDLGKSGRVSGKTDDGKISVKVDERPYTWTLNPACCTRIGQGSDSIIQNSDSDSDTDTDPDMHRIEDALMALDPRFIRPELLVQSAAKNGVRVVKAIIQRYPHEINIKNSGKTALHLSSLQGHAEIVKILIEAGADITATDDEGNTPVHYAVHREDNPSCLRVFLEHGDYANLMNFKAASVLHWAVQQKHPNCIRTLLEFGCNVNAQDQSGDTALHDAIRTGNREIVAILTQCPHFDYSILNYRGFNVLQWAACASDASIVGKIVEAAPHLVNQQRADGFAPLHLTSYFGHREATEVLITKGRANLELKNGVGHTPLVVALNLAKIATMEILIKRGADPDTTDADGDTCLHLVLNVIASQQMGLRQDTKGASAEAIDISDAPDITSIVAQLPPTMLYATWVGIAVFLVQHGSSIYKQNNRGKTPLQMITDQSIIGVLLDASKKCSTKLKSSAMPSFNVS